MPQSNVLTSLKIPHFNQVTPGFHTTSEEILEISPRAGPQHPHWRQDWYLTADIFGLTPTSKRFKSELSSKNDHGPGVIWFSLILFTHPSFVGPNRNKTSNRFLQAWPPWLLCIQGAKNSMSPLRNGVNSLQLQEGSEADHQNWKRWIVVCMEGEVAMCTM